MSFVPRQELEIGAFGETITANLTPVVQTTAVYNHIHINMETFSATGGTVSASDQQFICTTGTSVGGYGVIRSQKAVVYKAGEGIVARWTARFTSPVASSLQFGGLFTSTDGFYIGYSGTTFGCIHEYGGAHEIRRLTLTAGASGTESLTVVVNDDSHTFNVTSGSAALNASEIVTELNANIAGWSFYQNGSQVEGYATAVGAKSGTYSFTNNTGGGTCAASWAQVTAGVATTRDVVAQADWNGDALPFTLDQTKGNVYQVRYQYLGYGAIKYYIENPVDGMFILVHTIRYANANTIPSVTNPAMKVGWSAASLGSTTDLTVAGGSASIFVEGRDVIPEDTRSKSNLKSIGTTETNILTLRNRRLFQGKANQGEVKLLGLLVSNDSSKGAVFRMYHNGTIGGTQNFTYIDENHSVVEFDTAGTTHSGGREIIDIPVAGDSDRYINLLEWNEEILPDTVVAVTGEINSGAASDLRVSVIWREDI